MRIVGINTFNYGSTGNIMLSIAKTAEQEGHETINLIAASRINYKKKGAKQIIIGSIFSRQLHIKVFNNFTGLNGCFSFVGTLFALHKIQKFNPDVIHFHNLHNCYINLPMLFNFIKKHKIKIIWTLHDCWSFTGQCPHFTMVKCEKWKTGCYDCPQTHNYPSSFVDRTKTMYKLKKKWFTGVKDLIIVTPSQWLADLVKQSYLKEYPVKVINNGIDLDIFKPTPSDFRRKYDIGNDKKIVLGVAFGWGIRKGIDVFIELSKVLNNDYQIVLVGTDEEIDKILPRNIISIHRTHDQKELAEIYTAADVFANPTREENYPTVNMEAIACGIPVITFKTGGSPEIVTDKTGVVVPCDNIEAMKDAIVQACSNSSEYKNACLDRSKNFDKNEKYQDYVDLYSIS